MVVALVMALALLWTARTKPGPSTASAAALAGKLNAAQHDEEIQRFIRREIDPLLTISAGRDRAAVDRAIDSLHERFQTFHEGVDPFVEDVSSWTTRFGVVGRKTRDVWNGLWGDSQQADSVRDYISEKFQAQVLSEESLRDAVTQVIADFRSDLAANRNELFVGVSAAIRAGDAPIELREIDMGLFDRELDRQIKSLASDASVNTITSGIVVFASSAAAEEIARRVAYQLLARLVTYMAADAAVTSSAGAGATVTGAALGGTGGSTVGPVGTAIGIGVGLAVGVAVDWWMTAQFEEKLAGECHAYLDRMEKTLIDGLEDDDSRGGLRQALAQSIQLNQRVQRTAILARVNKEAVQ